MSSHTGTRYVLEHTTGPIARYLPSGSDHRWLVALSQLERPGEPGGAPQPVTVVVTVEDVVGRTAPTELVLLPADARLLAELMLDGADRAEGKAG